MAIEGSHLLNARTILKTLGLRPGMIVADLGCGAKGYFVLQAAKLVGEKGRVYGVDVVKSALKSVESRARMEGLNNIATVWSNLEIPGAANIPNGRLDIAFLFNLLYQSKKRKELFQEAMRLVKSGGEIAVIDWEEGGPLGPLAHERAPKGEAKTLAKAAGLREVRAFEAGPYHYGLLFQKP